MKKLSLLLFLQFIIIFCYAQDDIPERPNPPKLVNDAAGLLSPEEVSALEQKLKIYSDTTSTQIAIVIVPSIGDYEVVDYTQRLGQKWGVGQKEKNNGIVILLAAKEHKTAIVTGYGMEGSIPDAYTKRIQNEIMKPRFKEGNFYLGLDQATDQIIQLASGEYKGEPAEKKGKKISPLLVIIIIIILLGFFRKNRSPRGSTFSSRGVFMGGGGFGGFGRGGGGGGGGGFGGFGGGGFGGGGSSGDW